MKGLLLKDFLVLIKQMKILLILIKLTDEFGEENLE